MTSAAYVVMNSISPSTLCIPLSDTFGGTSLDTSKWTEFDYESGAGTVAEGSGVLSISETGGIIGIQSNIAYDLTESSASVAVESIESNASFDLITAMTDPGEDSDSLYKLETVVVNETGIIHFGYYNGSAGWSDVTATYDADDMRFWRYREAAGTLYWETSSGGVAWTVQRSLTDPFTLTSLYAMLFVSTVGTSTFANFNTPAPTGPGVVTASAIILSAVDAVISELEVQAFFNYGDSEHDIRDAVAAAVRAAAGDSTLHVEFI